MEPFVRFIEISCAVLAVLIDVVGTIVGFIVMVLLFALLL